MQHHQHFNRVPQLMDPDFQRINEMMDRDFERMRHMVNNNFNIVIERHQIPIEVHSKIQRMKGDVDEIHQIK